MDYERLSHNNTGQLRRLRQESVLPLISVWYLFVFVVWDWVASYYVVVVVVANQTEVNACSTIRSGLKW